MTQNEITQRQQPIKDRYLNEPDSALVRISAEGRVSENITCIIRSGESFKEAGLHPAAGGSGIHLCSADMLLESIIACAGITLRAAALSMGINLRNALISTEGELDFRGTLGMSPEASVGFRNLRLTFDIDADADEAEIKKLIEETEKYCIVYQTLKNPPEIEINLGNLKTVNI